MVLCKTTTPTHLSQWWNRGPHRVCLSGLIWEEPWEAEGHQKPWSFGIARGFGAEGGGQGDSSQSATFFFFFFAPKELQMEWPGLGSWGLNPNLLATMGDLQLGVPHMSPPSLLHQIQSRNKQHFYLLASRWYHHQGIFSDLLFHKDPLRQAAGIFAHLIFSHQHCRFGDTWVFCKFFSLLSHKNLRELRKEPQTFQTGQRQRILTLWFETTFFFSFQNSHWFIFFQSKGLIKAQYRNITDSSKTFPSPFQATEVKILKIGFGSPFETLK